MKSYCKILCLILFSLTPFWFFDAARAAENLEIVLQDGDNAQSWQLPANIAASWDEKDQTVRPKVLRKKTQNLDQYLAQSFEKKTEEQFSNQTIRDYYRLVDFFRSQIMPKLIASKSQDAVWEEKNGRVVNFKPDISGKSYDAKQIIIDLQEALKKNLKQVTIKPVIVPAKIKLADLNPYGVAALVATGSSNFAGSSANRIHNIRVGASRYQGYLIPPGETFSFNDLLGPVDGEHGFAPELVIKDNSLIPEFGGGICQVSTTVFRAALNGGLPIVERRNHSFAVQYYAPQGTDATIYPGVQDLKFVNDTKAHLLIWHTIKGTTLTFEFYGQPDGRKVQVANPVRYDVKQNGAFKTSLSRKIIYADGKSKEDVFYSNYRPQSEFTRTTTAAEPPKTVSENQQTTPPPSDSPANTDTKQPETDDVNPPAQTTTLNLNSYVS